LESWLIWGVDFLPGTIVGGLLGWYLIRPVNALLGSVFPGSNVLFEWLASIQGRPVAAFVRASAIALAVYVGLLALTGWQFVTAPAGVIPQQDKGDLLLNLQLPDAAAVDRTQRIVGRIEQVALSTPGVEHTLSVAGR